MVLIKQLKGYQNYLSTINKMEQIVESIKNNKDKNEHIWLLEHKNVFTTGSSSNIKNPDFIEETPVITTNRGGQMTYHGPGQLVIYFMLNIKMRGIGLIEFINKLEILLIESFEKNKIKLYQKKEKNRGLWIKTNQGMKKVIFIGLRYSGGIIFHGISINFEPNLEKFRLINPCGLNALEISSFKEQKLKFSYNEIIKEIKNQISLAFPHSPI
ncbi:MAG: lipoyl(octanoyl) transferase LipB [Proteobacteria bacterium]|nr:lipoyl(octanoyl) transferase LipB [Pseudomonadota bacterium]